VSANLQITLERRIRRGQHSVEIGTAIHPTVYHDVSPDFTPSVIDRRVITMLLRHEATPRAIRKFAKLHRDMTDYGYWFTLGTLWVSYTGHSDIALWRRLLSSPRPNRATSLMKPSELAAFTDLPNTLTVYRAHRPNETDWLATTLVPAIAARFARERNVSQVAQYTVPKADALCLFLRRKEHEILLLDRSKVTLTKEIPVVSKCPANPK